MTDSENIAWIVDHMVAMMEQMGKMQGSITWIIGELITMKNSEPPVYTIQPMPEKPKEYGAITLGNSTVPKEREP
jgi:hypothetical protein